MLTRKLTATLSAAALMTSGCTVTSDAKAQDAGDGAGRPNIIYFLVDDLSADLLPYMDTVKGLADGGATFQNFFVSNALCCPSRASMFTGEHPHTTGVKMNNGPEGGFEAFKRHEERTYATALEKNYRTGYMGKYLNGYPMKAGYHVPPGWDEWHVGNNGGYSEYDYKLSRYIEGKHRGIGNGRGRYLVDVLGERAANFLKRAREDDKPSFFLQVAPFSPHSGITGDEGSRFPAANRDRLGGEFPNGDCGGTDCAQIEASEKLQSFDVKTENRPEWMRGAALTDAEKEKLTRDFRDRIRMVQVVDDMVEHVLKSMTEAERNNTYILFGSDNGFHVGQHRLLHGKTTALDHDARVPLLVRRPGASGGTTEVPEIAQNVDLYATFADIANGSEPGPTSRDGRSLLPLIHGQHPADWRNAALIENWAPVKRAPGIDPDAVNKSGNAQPPTYRALRTVDDLLVDYDAYEPFEYYDLQNDAAQEHNEPAHPRVDELQQPLRDLAQCGLPGYPSCWEAAHVQ